MTFHRQTVSVFTVACFSAHVAAAADSDVQALLSHAIIPTNLPLAEVQVYTESRVPQMPKVSTVAEWEQAANRMRRDALDKVIFRGEAAKWRTAKTRVEWLDTIPGGIGYSIRKLRYEALPGLWIPALLYVPEKLSGKVPVALSVNGHDPNGKAADYKQIRCINLARRGMIVLNTEWLGMGQLRTDNFLHYRMNQLDLCGTSGIAPFYLAMSRALDLLLALEHADPDRVAVSGLSGGGWQTIFISSLDTRVKLCNPVAGYSSFRTRARFVSDLGDSEQTPCDLGTVTDYALMTAMLAPRAALLTFNAKDNCCFASDHALLPLLDAARPIFQLHGREPALQWHVNYDPGTHNYEIDNRQRFYRMVGEHFFAGNKGFDPREIPSESEVKTKEQFQIELPADNADFHTLALALSKNLPRNGTIPSEPATLKQWRQANRKKLREIVSAKDYQVSAECAGKEEKGGLQATFWRLRMGKDWTVPVVELVRGNPKETAILVADGGRKGAGKEAEQLLAAGKRVLAVDPFYFGESKIAQRDFLFALLVATVGNRPLGLQASQVAAIARWSQAEHKTGPVTVVTSGPRSSTFALVAAALEEKAIGGLELQGALTSLKDIIGNNWSVDRYPELFCFGLLESFDVPQLKALVAPRPVRAAGPPPS